MLITNIFKRRAITVVKHNFYCSYMAMRNVEIKAKVDNFEDLLKKAEDISQSKATLILQDDTFFKSERGRLKLRVFEDGNAELIYYERPDTEGPKLSTYEKCNVPAKEVKCLKDVLSCALGKIGHVKKKRYLYMVGSTRVHIDNVEGLGNFMELEVQLKENQSVEEGEEIAKSLMKQLGIKEANLLSGAYTDFLNNQ